MEALILALLGPILVKCLDQVSSETPSEYLRPHFNEVTGKMSPDIVHDAMPATRRAILKARRQASREDRQTMSRYSKEDVYNLAEKKLIEAMNAPPEKVADVYAAAKLLGDDE